MSDSSPVNTISGRNAFIHTLLNEGITRMFGNPGTTELPIMHALADYPEMGYVLAMQESVVIGIADGFSRASGELVACNVHVAPGLGNAMGAIYTSKIAGTPMIVTAGQQEIGHGLTEPLLYDPLVPIAQSQVNGRRRSHGLKICRASCIAPPRSQQRRRQGLYSSPCQAIS